MSTREEYRGFTLRSVATRVDIYKGPKFITWALSLKQAKRMIDDMALAMPA